ncbi:MAG TPA: T9SS type A sorting domain-containing protein [Bacteroidota bacterium]|nr:T9SS type A sorting domain-containing protein [Bacteroidota bacterium]
MQRIFCVLAAAGLAFSNAPGQFVQQGGKLIGTGTGGIASQGSSLSVSGDGTTAILGGPYDSSGVGAAWIFVRVNGVWSQQGEKLVGTGVTPGTSPARQGTSVALSADGSTAIVGGPGDNSRSGAAWIYTRTDGIWTQQGGKLVGTGAVDGLIGASQGQSVSLSADGNTAIVGGPLDSSGYGAVWVFTRNAGVWSQQGGKLAATTASGEALQGWSVALSGDGNTAIVGGIYDLNNAGAAWIFVRANGTWTQQGFKLYGVDAGEGANQGWSVALSADGNRAIMGGSGDIGGTGAVWVFTRTNGVWSQEGGKIVGTGATGLATQGESVALSADGNTALVGGPADSLGNGAAWVFTRSAGTWTQQGNKISGRGQVRGIYGANQGSAVALTSDGNTALVGGSNDNSGAGAAWAFTRNGTTWSQQGEKLVGSGARGSSSQGASVSASADGNTVLVGGPNDSTGTGAAWVFTRQEGVWGQMGGKLVGSGALGPANQATSVSLSSDGNTAAMGAPADSAGGGATWVFTRNASSWSQQGTKLVGRGGVNGPDGAGQGSSVALSADGTTLIVGGPNDSTGTGAAWIFARSSGSWIQQGNKLKGSGAAGPARQGHAVAISADGNTAMIGGPNDNGGAGAIWVFVRTGGVWTQQGGKLPGNGGSGASGMGSAVSLSSDGNRALAGGPGDSAGTGACWAFVRSGTAWSQSGGKFTGRDADAFAGFGGSVSIAATGLTAVIGGAGDNTSTGACWVFTRSGEVWSQSGGKIAGRGSAGNSRFGGSVSLSADGNTFIAGGEGDNSDAGAAWVFVQNPSGVSGSPLAPAPGFALEQNYPNPFNPATTIRFETPRRTRVRLDVYNSLGERVASLVDGPLSAGSHAVTFNASRLSSGVYVCSLRAGEYRRAIKMLLLR